MKKAVIFLLLAMISHSVLAQEKTERSMDEKYPLEWFVGVGGGFNYSVAATRYSSDWVTHGFGTSLDVYGGKWFTHRFGVRLGYHGINTSADEKTDRDNGSHPFLYMHADAMLRVTTWLIPYFHAGYINVNHKAAGVRKSSLGVGVGFKFPIRMSDNLSFVPGIRATMMNGDVLQAADVNTKSLRYKFSATVGVVYHFGRPKPRVEHVVVEKEVPYEVVVRDTVHIHTHTVDTVYIHEKAEVLNRAMDGLVLFDTNSAYLRSEAYPVLNEAVSFLKENPNVKVRVEGHADTSGNDRINQPLSERRARSVADYLTAHGISPDRVSSVGYGSKRPRQSNDTAEGRQQNRRMEFVFDY